MHPTEEQLELFSQPPPPPADRPPSALVPVWGPDFEELPTGGQDDD